MELGVAIDYSTISSLKFVSSLMTTSDIFSVK